MFWSFISYGTAAKLFTISTNYSAQFLIKFNPNTLFYYYWNMFYCNKYHNVIWFKTINLSCNNYFNMFKYTLKLSNNVLKINNNKITDLAFLSYLKFYNNYLTYLQLINNNLLTSNISISYVFIKNVINFNNIYIYKLKNISNIFIYNVYKYINSFNLILLMFVFISSVYIFNVYRISIIWYLGIIIFIKILFIFYFITNMLRVSKKIYIILYFFFLVYLINLFLYNEVNIEYISTVNLNICYIFSLVIIYFMYKYNLFFLLFLELSIVSGKSILYIFKQYCRDVLNILAYFLRIFLLFIRLNIYDGLDDFFDSYYIFIGDFDAYNYLEIIHLYTYNIMPSFYDNIYDKSILNYEETELYLNIIYLYTILLIKFLIFLLLLLEGGFRLLLASYIFILVLLEINNFNVIFIEHKN